MRRVPSRRAARTPSRLHARPACGCVVVSDGTLEYRQVDTGYEPALFLIQKFAHVPERATETGTKEVSLAEYYVLHGTIYQAPDLQALCASRVVRGWVA